MEISSMIMGGSGQGSEAGCARQPLATPELQDLANLSLGDRLAAGDNDSQIPVTKPLSWTFLDVLDLLRQYAVPSIDLWSGVGTVEAVNNTGETSLAATLTKENTLQRTARHYSHALGGGYSAVVLQHTTAEDVFEVTTQHDVFMRREPGLVTRSGTVVAFKKISPRPFTNGESKSSSVSEAFHSICQEIEVCRHPLLQKHENISRLLYVAWERLETFPWIALELAAFGTLEDVLTAPG